MPIHQPSFEISLENPFPDQVKLEYEMPGGIVVPLYPKYFCVKIMDCLEANGLDKATIHLSNDTTFTVFFDRIKKIIELDRDCSLSFHEKQIPTGDEV